MSRLPPWIRIKLDTDRSYLETDKLVARYNLNTVCSSARCPNRHECWNRATATFMIMGDTCTRNCHFCAVNTGTPGPLDPDEPDHVARAAVDMKLRHIVITSVTRDDLDDGGAAFFAETILQVKRCNPKSTVEVLTPDFNGSRSAIMTVINAEPDVFNHNLETVSRLQVMIRPHASYECSLNVLNMASRSRPKPIIKSGLMLGLGETRDEVSAAMDDLLRVGCEFLTLGQYLRPTQDNIPVEYFVRPEEFSEYEHIARKKGFKAVASGPLVRSSYMAESLLDACRE